MELIKIGKVLKTHGYKGFLKIFIDAFYMDDFRAMNAIFVHDLPYFIASREINSESSAILSLEEIDSKEKAQALQGKEIFARTEDLTEILEEDVYADLEGYSILDDKLGNIGVVEAIVELPHQHLAKISKDQKEILVPLNDALIVEIDDSEKIIRMNLPDGLLDIF
jgi:16S rRNA processing protein RimM